MNVRVKSEKRGKEVVRVRSGVEWVLGKSGEERVRYEVVRLVESSCSR